MLHHPELDLSVEELESLDLPAIDVKDLAAGVASGIALVGLGVAVALT